MHQPLDRLASLGSHLGNDRFDQESGQARSLLVNPHGRHHEVPVLGPDTAAVADDALMRNDPDDPTVLHGNEHLSISVYRRGLRPPRRQSADDSGHLVEPRRCTADIERVELFGIVVACVTENHSPDGSIGAIGPFGAHFLPVGFRNELRRPPFSKLRFGSTPGASNAVDNRWMVDHRASSRPFSIREMSACATPARSASSACVQPKSIRRSRIEPPGLVSPAMVARPVIGTVYVDLHMTASARAFGSPVSLTVTLKSACYGSSEALSRAFVLAVGIPRLPPVRPRASMEIHEKPAEGPPRDRSRGQPAMV